MYAGRDSSKLGLRALPPSPHGDAHDLAKSRCVLASSGLKSLQGAKMTEDRGCCVSRKPGLRLSVLLLAATAVLAVPHAALAFERGTSNISITLGAGRAVDRTYTVIGGRIGHYIADGFEFAVAAEFWTDNDPDIFKITPEARYVWYGLAPAKPYVGGFVSRTMYNGLPDRNTYGAKGGVYFQVGPNAHLGVGVVYERVESCDRSTYRDCDQLYPEAAFSVRF